MTPEKAQLYKTAIVITGHPRVPVMSVVSIRYHSTDDEGRHFFTILGTEKGPIEPPVILAQKALTDFSL